MSSNISIESGSNFAHLLNDASRIIEQAQANAFHVVNAMLVKRNWLLGMRIQIDILKEQRADYGESVVTNLAKQLTIKYGKGFGKSNLYSFINFYLTWPNIFHAVNGKLDAKDVYKIFHAESGKSEQLLEYIEPYQPIRLSWTHYRIILQEQNSDAREWYANEATQEMWSTRTLQRNISSQYYHRLLKAQDKALVRDEMKSLTNSLQDKLEYVKIR